jgi:simple sugar transport system ATP-binding protein
VSELSESFGLAVDPNALISAITVGQQQRVEILKALYRGAEILILDEPTAVLTPQEAKELFEIINELKAQGKSIVFISHKLNEVLEIADRISVLRRGKLIETIPRAGATEEGLARSMVGREVLLRVEKSAGDAGRAAAASRRPRRSRRPRPRGCPRRLVRGSHERDRRHRGVDGNGQSELIDALTGLRHPASGSIQIGGEELSRATAREALDAGMGHIPRTASVEVLSSSSTSPRTSCCTTTAASRSPARLDQPAELVPLGARPAAGVRRAWRRAGTRGARSPAATNRRS